MQSSSPSVCSTYSASRRNRFVRTGRDVLERPLQRDGRTILRFRRLSKHGLTCKSTSTRGSSKATRFQVEHQTFIPVGREQFWRLLKDLTPAHKWEALAPAFACLESIYRVEYNLVVEEALKAYRDANNATIPNLVASLTQQQASQNTTHGSTTAPKSQTSAPESQTADRPADRKAPSTRGAANGSSANGTSAERKSPSANGAANGSTNSNASAERKAPWVGPSGGATASSTGGASATNVQDAESGTSAPTLPTAAPNGTSAHITYSSTAMTNSPAGPQALRVQVTAAATVEPQTDVDSSGGEKDQLGEQLGEQSIEAQLILTGQQVEHELQQAGQELVETIKTLDRMAQEASQQQAEWEAAKKLQEQAEQEAAEKLWHLDRRFMELVWYLSARAHFAPLGLRDILLSRCLNSDYLWQLFIKAGPYRLDNSLMTALVNPLEHNMSNGVHSNNGSTNRRTDGTANVGTDSSTNGSITSSANGRTNGSTIGSSTNGSTDGSTNGSVASSAEKKHSGKNETITNDSRIVDPEVGSNAKGISNLPSWFPKMDGTFGTAQQGVHELPHSGAPKDIGPPWEGQVTLLNMNDTYRIQNSYSAFNLNSTSTSSTTEPSIIRLSSMSDMSLQTWAALRRDWFELPEEAQHVMVLKRAYGQDVQSGRLIIQKLDYLQLLLVKSSWRALKDGVTAVMEDMKQFWNQSRERLAAGQPDGDHTSEDDDMNDATTHTHEGVAQGRPSTKSNGVLGREGGGERVWVAGDGEAGIMGFDAGVEQAQKEREEREGIQGWAASLLGGLRRGRPSRIKESQREGQVTTAHSNTNTPEANKSSTRQGTLQKAPVKKAVQPPKRVKSQQRRPLQRLYNWVQVAGCAAVNVLVEWGLLPELDIPTLSQVNKRFPIKHEKGKPATLLEKQSLEELFGGWDGFWGPEGPVRTFLSRVEVLEPTYKEMLVLYRNKPKRNRLRTWIPSWIPFVKPPALTDGPMKRPPITLRIYHDIPMPTWKVVYPDKLLQFRPLDLIRMDLFAFTGIAAAVAQARYDSIILDFVTLTTFTVLAIRVTLGYKRMVDRYENSVNELLREKTVAGNEGAVEYLGSNASSQQFKQAALAYALLAGESGPLDAEEVARRAESAILQVCGQQVRFDVYEALAELKRLGLLHLCPPADTPTHTADSPASLQSIPSSSAYSSHVVISDPATVQFIVKGHWERLLWQRVDKVLQSVDEDTEELGVERLKLHGE